MAASGVFPDNVPSSMTTPSPLLEPLFPEFASKCPLVKFRKAASVVLLMKLEFVIEPVTMPDALMPRAPLLLKVLLGTTSVPTLLMDRPC